MNKCGKNYSVVKSKFAIVSTMMILFLMSFNLQLVYSETFNNLKSEETAVRPRREAIADGQGAISFFDSDYQLKMINDGLKGYNKVIEAIENNPERGVLAVNLNCLSAFYAAYEKIAAMSYCKKITSIVNTLLKSDNSDDVQAIVTAIYYEFDFSAHDGNKEMVEQLEKLRTTSKDEYTVRFATLSLNKMYKLSGFKENKYPVPKVREHKTAKE